MPRLNGTGPMGQGPRTGRGLGPCGGGYGYGRGYGRGRGRGFGFGNYSPWGEWSYRQPTEIEEKAIVQDDIAILKEELKAAEERLRQLENNK